MTFEYRPYEPARDRDAAMVMLREVGWVRDSEQHERANDLWFGTGRTLVTDPIAEHLNDETRARWSGVGGDYVVTLGPESHAERTDARASGLPTMSTSVNTFSRLWLGVSPPTALAYTSADLDAPRELLERLDRVVVVRDPNPDWDF